MSSAQSAHDIARALLAQMTLDEKIQLTHSFFFMSFGAPANLPADALGAAGYVPGVARLGVPAQQQSDASLGVTPGPTPREERRKATALPASIALAASWNARLARRTGEMVGTEARALGVNVMLAGGCNLTRDPRCGRNFEYAGEDPLLAGTLVGESIAGVQSASIVSTIKHFALNAQETGRHLVDEQIDQAALRESDLLAFQIAIERGTPGAVMMAYNRVNGAYCSEHAFLINEVLKGDWNYQGWVMSDWGSVHSTRAAALAGLDQQSGAQLDPEQFFAEPLRALAESDPIVAARVDDMVLRMLRSLAAAGVLADPPRVDQAADFSANRAIAQEAAEEGIVLLKNASALLPLTTSAGTIALIGRHADRGVLAGGGSSCVMPEGCLQDADPESPIPMMPRVYHPSSPLEAIRARAPHAEVRFADGGDLDAAAALARACDVAIVFAERWDCEAGDADLSLPGAQDALIAAVARANARVVVVLQTGGPVLTPWLDDVGALLQAWYSGHRGGEALARVVFGDVNPSGRLPLSFPRSTADLPRPEIPGFGDSASRQGLTRYGTTFVSRHVEGADVGYRWYETQGKASLFPFGFGLSYTTFAFDKLVVESTDTVRIACSVTNSGDRAGAEVVQVYARPPHAGAAKRLVAFAKVMLAPGETKTVALEAEPRLLARFDVTEHCWRIEGGAYEVLVGASSAHTPLRGSATLSARAIRA